MEGGKIVFKEESYLIMGCCFEVYKEKGNGFLESVYQECMEIEFEFQKVPFVRKPKLDLTYKGKPLSQKYEPDLIAFDEVILELKAVKDLADEHRAQVLNYLKATKKKLGLLVNFGSFPKLQYERFVNVE